MRLGLVRGSRLVRLALDALPIIALGWVLLHLVLLYRYGSVIIVEQNRTILTVEILVILVGLGRSLVLVWDSYR